MTVAARADNIQMIKSLVAADVGIGLLTSLDVGSEVAAGELAFVALSDPVLRRFVLGLCVAPARTLSRAANLVVDRNEVAFAKFGAAD